MKLFFGASFAFLAGVEASSVRGVSASSKMEVCHETKDENDYDLRRYKTLSVSSNAVGHLKHGDLEGNCARLCEGLCNPSPNNCYYHEALPVGDDCSCTIDPYYLCGQHMVCNDNDVCVCEPGYEELEPEDASDPNPGCKKIDQPSSMPSESPSQSRSQKPSSNPSADRPISSMPSVEPSESSQKPSSNPIRKSEQVNSFSRFLCVR